MAVTPADQSLLAQLRQLLVEWRRATVNAHAQSVKSARRGDAAGGDVCEVESRAYAECVTSLDAILEAQPPETDDCGPDNPACGCVQPADTPTGLAPLRTITQDEYEWLDTVAASPHHIGGIVGHAFELAVKELAAQRQASASVRREAMAALKRYRPGAYGAMVEDEGGKFVDIRDLESAGGVK